jgi:hypothetical protein
MRDPIFVTGLRKSGTSLVKTLLDGHPEVFMFPANEFEFFHYTHHDAVVAAKYMHTEDVDLIRREMVQNPYITRLNRTEEGSADYRPSVDIEGWQREVLATEVETYPELMELLLTAMARHCSHFHGDLCAVRFAAKCVLNCEYFPELRAWFPDVRMVYVLRNPYGHFNAIRESSRRGARYEGQRLSKLRHRYPILGTEIRRMRLSYYFMRKWSALDPEHFYVLVYDRLLENPERELRDLATFLGIAYDSSLLQPTIAGEKWTGNSWKVPAFDQIDKRPLTHWKEDISKLEIRLINLYFGDVLEEYGFERIESREQIWKPIDWSERPIEYVVNRLLFKTRAWFSEIPLRDPRAETPPSAASRQGPGADPPARAHASAVSSSPKSETPSMPATDPGSRTSSRLPSGAARRTK